MIKKIERIIFAVLAFSMLFAFPVSAATFPDVGADAWYGEKLDMLMTYTPGIISGIDDEDGVRRFFPENYLKRGEFLRMISVAAELYTASPAPGGHWAAKYWQMCYENEVLLLDSYAQTQVFGYSFDELEKPITRYEMAVVVANATRTGTAREARVAVTNAANSIPDYNQIPDEYKDAVEQVYGKGIIKGITNTGGIKDGSFCGDRTLRRCDAVVVIYLLLWAGERKAPDFAEKEEIIEVPDVPADPEFVSFAMRYRNMSTAERQTALFGDPNKTHFTSAADANGWMVEVEVPVWKVDKSGNKYSSKAYIEVHKLVAEEVKLIFDEIYNDPERFPINAVGGARYTDALRHSWGCAIDINPNENYYCRTVNGVTTALVGNGWWPGSNQHSISPNGSVVKAFAKYGWGWGGQGYSGGYYDYMHFSILHYGG